MTRVFLELRNTSDFLDPIYLFYDPGRSLTADGYGVPRNQRALVGLAPGVWVINKTDSSEYFLGGWLMVERPAIAMKKRFWSGTLAISKARFEVTGE